MARAWSLLRIQRLQLLPSTRRDVISVEVIDSVVSVVAAKDINAASMYNSSVTISWTRWRCTPVLIKLTPCVCWEVEAEKVVATIGSIVSSKYVEIIIHCNWSVQRPRTGWVHFVGLRWLDLVPRIRLFQHVRVGPSNYVCVVEKWCIKSWRTPVRVVDTSGCQYIHTLTIQCVWKRLSLSHICARIISFHHIFKFDKFIWL